MLSPHQVSSRRAVLPAGDTIGSRRARRWVGPAAALPQPASASHFSIAILYSANWRRQFKSGSRVRRTVTGCGRAQPVTRPARSGRRAGPSCSLEPDPGSHRPPRGDRAKPRQPGSPCGGFFWAAEPPMCAAAQSSSADCGHHCSVNLRALVVRMTIMKLREINQDIASRHARDVVHGPARIQGGNWNMPGFRSAGHVHDDAECQISIAEFMSEHGLLKDSDEG